MRMLQVYKERWFKGGKNEEGGNGERKRGIRHGFTIAREGLEEGGKGQGKGVYGQGSREGLRGTKAKRRV